MSSQRAKDLHDCSNLMRIHSSPIDKKTDFLKTVRQHHNSKILKYLAAKN